MNNIGFRIALDIIILVCVINGWWFVALPLAIAGVWYFSYFVEALIAGIMFDALFGLVPIMGTWGFVGTIAAIVVMTIVVLLKKKLRK